MNVDTNKEFHMQELRHFFMAMGPVTQIIQKKRKETLQSMSVKQRAGITDFLTDATMLRLLDDIESEFQRKTNEFNTLTEAPT